MPLPGVVEGYVRANGSPIEGVDVSIGGMTVKTTLQGHYLTFAKAGTHSTCKAEKWGYVLGPKSCTVKSGQTTVLDFSFPQDYKG